MLAVGGLLGASVGRLLGAAVAVRVVLVLLSVKQVVGRGGLLDAEHLDGVGGVRLDSLQLLERQAVAVSVVGDGGHSDKPQRDVDDARLVRLQGGGGGGGGGRCLAATIRIQNTHARHCAHENKH